jgi:hypothetical protein
MLELSMREFLLSMPTQILRIPGKPSMYVGADGLSKVSPEKMEQGGLNAVVMALAVGTNATDC